MDTANATARWHDAFNDCAEEGTGCAEAAKLYGPVLHSVQIGLAELLASAACQKYDIGSFRLTTEDFVDCPGPGTSTKLVALVSALRRQFPAEQLAQFPLNGVVRWAEQTLNEDAESPEEPGDGLPEEADDHNAEKGDDDDVEI